MNIIECPECNSNEIRRSAIVTKHITHAYNSKLNFWFTVEESEDKLHGDSYIYFCNECDFESEEYTDFGLKDNEES